MKKDIGCTLVYDYDGWYGYGVAEDGTEIGLGFFGKDLDDAVEQLERMGWDVVEIVD